jgi:TolB-like protein/Tfp pilus assembly protein PilF
LFNELKRRNVFRVAIAYVVVAWLIVQVADVMIDNIGAPDWLFQAIVLVLALGFPLVLLFAWAFELTPQGLKREKDVDRSQSIAPQTGRNLDRAIIAVLVLALGYFVWDKFRAEKGSEPFSQAETAQITEQDAGKRALTPFQTPDKSIAVLPFVNMSADADNEYFSDGLSEELLNLLAKVDGLKVAARTSSFKFKNSEADIAEIGQKLNVATILEGSVRKAGNQARITAQLIKVDDGFHLWSETYDRSLDNIFEVQDEIARAIVDALKLPLLGQDAAPVAAKATANFEAFDLYLLGRHHASQINAAGFRNAVDYFTRAVASDPNYAPAWSGLAEAYLGLADYGSMPTPEAYGLAGKAIEKAVQLDPGAPETLVAQGSLLSYQGRGHEALPLLEKAVKLSPNNVEALNALTSALLDEDPERAPEFAQKAWSLDPLSERTRVFLILAKQEAGDSDTAIRLAREMLLDDPENPGLFEAMGSTYLATGQYHLAIPNYEMTWKLRPGDVLPAMAIARSYLVLDDEEAAREWLEKARERGADSRWVKIIELAIHFHRQEWESMVGMYEAMLSDGGLTPQQMQFYGDALLRLDRPGQAEPLYRSVADAFGDASTPISSDLHADASLGLVHLLPDNDERRQRLAALRAHLDGLIERRPYDRRTWILQASIATVEGDRDTAFAAMEKAMEMGAMYRQALEFDPLAAKWQNDPEFRAILARMEQNARAQRDLLEASRQPPPADGAGS